VWVCNRIGLHNVILPYLYSTIIYFFQMNKRCAVDWGGLELDTLNGKTLVIVGYNSD